MREVFIVRFSSPEAAEKLLEFFKGAKVKNNQPTAQILECLEPDEGAIEFIPMESAYEF